MSKMKVTGWTYWLFDEELEKTKFRKLPDNLREDAEKVIIEEIRNKGYNFSGDNHQNYSWGAPILDNKYVYTASQRQWGYIMAIAHGKYGDSDYVFWAWNTPGEMVVPDKKEIVQISIPVGG